MACADVDGDGWMDILLAGEYMPITLLRNERGQFRVEQLAGTEGWWNTITVADLDGDGDPDFVLGNVGENNFFGQGLTVFLADFDQNGTLDQIACQATKAGHFPIHDIDELYAQMPLLKKKYRTYGEFAKAPLELLVPKAQLDKALRLHLRERRSLVLWNEAGQLRLAPLPREAQYSSVHAVLVDDFDQDGVPDLLLGGNDYRYKPQFGRQDASKGWLCKGEKSAEGINFANCQALNIDGQIRSIATINLNQIIIGVNDEKVQFYEKK
jgi:enediyne biosynthesis protein E4